MASAETDTWVGKRATLAGFSHELRKVRHFVHPDVWARERLGRLRLTKDVYRDLADFSLEGGVS